MKRRRLWIVGLLVMVCVLGIILIPSSPDGDEIAEASATPSASNTPAPPSPTLEPTETLEPLAALENGLMKALGTSNRDVDRMASFKFDEISETFFIKWAIDDNLTLDLIRYGAKKDAADIVRIIDDSGMEYEGIVLDGTFLMVDQFGNESESVVVELRFEKETVNKINWDNFLVENIYSISDFARIHPELQDE